ncbi:hypothetical protein L596_001880 [Steinernema carpocapsae]|uniref:Uncharacterized protein n=1 Tax=Steinernema carpocapsae TaxID=34508 RepID=A0A4U8UMT1_STECR|nr:hypothetical protein L596_001880 [Steinernema carpocapsae]
MAPTVAGLAFYVFFNRPEKCKRASKNSATGQLGNSSKRAMFGHRKDINKTSAQVPLSNLAHRLSIVEDCS